MLELGANHVTTIEYNKLTYAHPNITTISKHQFGALYACDSQRKTSFDIALSISSFDHDGLGRYGDPLNPFGDLHSISKIHCMLKDNGLFFLGVPVGEDAVEFNAHRIYGYARLSIVLALGFRLIAVHHHVPFRLKDLSNRSFLQPMFVLLL